MRRRAKPAKAKVEGQRPPAGKSPRTKDARVQELEKRLAEAHRQLTEVQEEQTATSEILRVISRSPTDVQPVFAAVAASARQLCDGTQGSVQTYDGALVHLAAMDQVNLKGADSLRRAFPMAPSHASASTRAILYREVIQIPDVLEDPEYVLAPAAQATGFRSAVSVPMLREGEPIGAITVTRAAPGSFSDSQVSVLKTFADQAVIAIENVRLFKELQASNRDLTEALDQQTATSEILKVINSSLTDVQPVFNAIAAAATALCSAKDSGVFLFDGTLVHLAAHHNQTPEDVEALRQAFPRPLDHDSVTVRAILTRAVAHVSDLAADPSYELHGGRIWVESQTGKGSTFTFTLPVGHGE